MWEKMIEYFKANPIYFYILVAIVAIILLLIIILIVRAAKKSKNKKIADPSATLIRPKTGTETTQASKQDPSATKTDVPSAATGRALPEENTSISAPADTEPMKAEEKTSPSPYEEKPADLYTVKQSSEKQSRQGFAEQHSDVAETSESAQPKEDEKASAPVQASESKESEPKENTAAETEKPSSPVPAVSAQKDAPVKNKAERSNSQRRAPKEKTAPQRDPAPEPEPRQTQGRIASRSAAEKLLVVHTPEDEERKSGYTGKWVIIKRDEDSYYFELRASNGEKLLGSIDYTSLSGAKNGIKTHKTNIQKNNIVISQSKNGSYYFKLLNGSKQLLCTGESYPTKSGCESAVESVRRFAETAVVVQQEDEE